MPTEYRTRTFKSGNSTALRLPKSLGFAEGEEVDIVPHGDGSFSFWKTEKRLDVLLSLYGAFSKSFMSEGRGDIDQQDYDWGETSHDQAA